MITIKCNDYRDMVLEEIKLNAAAEMASNQEEFLNYFTDILINAEELNEFFLLPFEGIGYRNKKIQIDGYSYDDLEDCLNIIICPFTDSIDVVSLTPSEAEKIFNRAKAFVENSESGYILANAEESSPGYGLAIDIKKKYKDVRKYKFYIITDMVMSEKLKEIKSDTLLGKNIEYSIWDISRFHKLYESKTGKEEIIIDLKEFTNHGIPCLPASKTEEYTAYLCNIPGKVLADLYNIYGGRLLEGNVRSFLTTRGKVNKGIRSTILNNPAMFFAYNNGIAATAYDVVIDEYQRLSYITKISSLQIVNGGQTTASLAMALINDKDRANNLLNIYVPMKLSIISPDKAQDLIPNISRYANSQNKVNEADFFSNHAFHVRIEDFSRRIIAPAVKGNQYGTKWYYERAKGQYNQEQVKLSIGDRKKFLLQNPKNQMFNKTDLAKYLNLYRMLPHIVSTGAQKNFLKFAEWAEAEWEKNNTVFHDGFFKTVIAIAILFKQTDKIVKKQSWYESGYKANIVAYSIAKLFYSIKNNYSDKALNVKMIWLKQSLSNALEDQLTIIAEKMFNHLISPSREIQNVTEWAKRESCWLSAKEIQIAFLKAFEDELVEKESVKQDQKDEKKEQLLANHAQAMIEVANFGLENWKYLIRWGIENKVLNQIEIEILKSVLKMESGDFPSEKQCIRILEILNRARIESFPK